jgi:hypothetical protein
LSAPRPLDLVRPRRPRRRRARGLAWLLAAGLLFVAGALVTAFHDQPPSPTPRVRIPRRMDEDEWQRLQRRRTLPEPPAHAVSETARPERAMPHDPMIAAMPPSVKNAAIVVEVNALRNSPIGDLLLACFMGQDNQGLRQLQGKSGVDPLKDVDRVAFVDGVVMVSGFLGQARWGELFPGATQERLNADTVLWTSSDRPIAVWKDQMAITAKSRDEVLETVARLEGGAPSSAVPVLSEDESYGEIYGAIAPAMLAEAFPNMPGGIGPQLGALAQDIRLHVDASRDVGIVADIRGDEKQGTPDLGKAIGAALVLGRLNAAREGDNSLAEVLDFARVHPSRDGFQLEVGLPLAFFQKQLAECAQRKRGAIGGGTPP